MLDVTDLQHTDGQAQTQTKAKVLHPQEIDAKLQCASNSNAGPSQHMLNICKITESA